MQPNGLDLNVPLDAIFRRNVLARPDTIALADPPNRREFTEGRPQRLTYAEAEAAVERLTRQLRAMRMPPAAVVAVQLPNIVEAVLALLAIERAGLTAALIPMAWRKSDLVRALAPVDATALVTLGLHGSERPALTACQAAAGIFTLSFPCAFGTALPDGVVPLQIDLDLAKADEAPAAEIGDFGISMLTFDAAPAGPIVVGRTHAEWVAAGLSVLIAARIAPGAEIASTLPLSSLAGIASALVPWLLSGGTLWLIEGSSPGGLEQSHLNVPHLVVPAAALNFLPASSRQKFESILAVHRVPGVPFDPGLYDGAITDVRVFGEVGAVVQRRRDPSRIEAIPIGRVTTSAGAVSPVGIETRIEPDGTLALRGAMVPHRAFAPAGNNALAIGEDGFVRTGYRCRAENAFELRIESGPVGIAMIGGLRFGLEDLQARIKGVAPDATIAYIPHATLGGRLVVESDDAAASAASLEAAGLAQLVIDAIVPRTKQQMAG